MAAAASHAGVYSDTGTAAQVTEALRGLVFTPTAGQVAAGQTVTTDFTIVDTDTATASATDSTTTVVTTDTGPRTLTWTGAANTSFTNAANWDDTTFGHTPALWAENASDTVAFGSNGRRDHQRERIPRRPCRSAAVAPGNWRPARTWQPPAA